MRHSPIVRGSVSGSAMASAADLSRRQSESEKWKARDLRGEFENVSIRVELIFIARLR